MHSVAHPHPVHACRLGHFQIQLTVTYPPAFGRAITNLVQQFVEHLRMWFGLGFVSAATAMEVVVGVQSPKHAVESLATLARGYCQVMSRIVQYLQNLPSTSK